MFFRFKPILLTPHHADNVKIYKLFLSPQLNIVSGGGGEGRGGEGSGDSRKGHLSFAHTVCLSRE